MTTFQAEDEFILVTAIKALLNAPPYHAIFEIALILWIVKLIFYSKSSSKDNRPRLTEAQEEELIAEWQPEPLVPASQNLDEIHENLPNQSVNKRLVSGIPKNKVTVNGKECINLATFNFLNFSGNKSHEQRAVAAIRKYGVGSCGPRGFYGTVDVHLNLEDELAKFLNVEEAILYSYGFATAASAIPAYSKRGDIIFADEQCNFSIQKGIDTSRSKVYYYEHNNMEHLEQLLKEQEVRDAKNKKKAAKTRKFIVTEGLFMNTGEICPLDEIVEFKYKYKVRIFLDESISFATLGKTGRGVTEYLNIDINKIDLVMCNLEFCLGSNGGFCAGSSYYIDHQRLSGLGYCFSASLPPLLTVASSESIKLIDEQPEMLKLLNDKIDLLHSCLVDCQREPGGKYPLHEMFVPYPNENSPIMHIYCELDQQDRNEARKALDKLVEICENDGVAIVQAAYLWDVEVLQSRRPSIRLTISTGLSDDEIRHACDVIRRNSVRIGRQYENMFSTLYEMTDEEDDCSSTPDGNQPSLPKEPKSDKERRNDRPSTLDLNLSVNSNNSEGGKSSNLLSSPALEVEKEGQVSNRGEGSLKKRVRTYSGSQPRVIAVKQLSSDDDSEDNEGDDKKNL